MSSLFGSGSATIQELLDLRHFYPEGCFYHYSGRSDEFFVFPLMLSKQYGTAQKFCVGCLISNCGVRLAPNPHLAEVTKAVVEEAFDAAGLPEVLESELEAGTYTNAQFMKAMADDLGVLLGYIKQLPSLDSAASKRSTLSFAVEMFLNE